MNWQPIKTAPRTGNVILTDEGFALWLNHYGNASGDIAGWYTDEDDSDNGRKLLHPNWWIELPPVPNAK